MYYVTVFETSKKLALLRFQSRTTISFGISGSIKYQHVILCFLFQKANLPYYS